MWGTFDLLDIVLKTESNISPQLVLHWNSWGTYRIASQSIEVSLPLRWMRNIWPHIHCYITTFYLNLLSTEPSENIWIYFDDYWDSCGPYSSHWLTLMQILEAAEEHFAHFTRQWGIWGSVCLTLLGNMVTLFSWGTFCLTSLCLEEFASLFGNMVPH